MSFVDEGKVLGFPMWSQSRLLSVFAVGSFCSVVTYANDSTLWLRWP